MKPIKKKLQFTYAALFTVILIAEILIALFVNDRFIRPYGGDVLVTILICCFIRIFIPDKRRILPVWVFLFCVAVEFAQYFNFVSLLSLDRFPLFRIVLGTYFSWIDLICYGAGCFAFFILDTFLRKHYTK